MSEMPKEIFAYNPDGKDMGVYAHRKVFSKKTTKYIRADINEWRDIIDEGANLPTDGKRYLVLDLKYGPATAHYDYISEKHCVHNISIIRPTHWMPLPEPPKE